MSETLLADVNAQVKTFWSDMFMDELKERSILPALVNKAYEGEIKEAGNKVRVSQINRPTASRKTVGTTGYDTFNTQKLSTSYVDITADQVLVAAYEFDSLVQLQSQIGQQDSKIRQGLLESMQIELNNYLYSLVSPSLSAPDHSIAGVTDFNAAQLNSVRMLAAQAKWMADGGWWLLVDPSYQTDLLNAATLTSSDYVGDDRPVVGGQIATRRFGFNILEDNSAGLAQVSPTAATSDLALAFHPDFMHLVMSTVPEFEVSSLHSNKQFGFVLSCKLIAGAGLGISGANKHIVVYNT